jgi:hypothetical protein
MAADLRGLCGFSRMVFESLCPGGEDRKTKTPEQLFNPQSEFRNPQ